MTTKKRTAKAQAARGRRPASRAAAAESQMRQIWWAGLGAVAATGETATELVDELIARGKKREPALVAAAERSLRDARRTVEKLASEAGKRSMRLFDETIEQLGVKPQPRSRNILHRLGDVAEALL